MEVIKVAIIILIGLISNLVFTKLKLPGLLGMLLSGIIIGPNVLNLMSPELMNVSGDLRKIALIIILLRAGIGLNKETLKKVGVNALKLAVIPGLIEGFTIILFSMLFFNLEFYQAGILGFTIAAVSPAVVVPSMLKLSEQGYGRKKEIPTMILAGASIDDVIAITIFSTFLGLALGKNTNIFFNILSIPISIILGILLGVIIGFLLIFIFKKFHIRDTKKVLIIIGTALLFTTIEDVFHDKIQIASLLGVMSIGFIILEKLPVAAKRLASKFEKIWIFAEIILFVLVGAQVDIKVIFDSGIKGLILIIIGLFGRSLGVLISLIKSNFNKTEKIFSVVAYMPKATVQAAIGSIPLMMGIESGELILAIAVLSIIFTAPLGAFLINIMGKKLEK
jgi:NhaP-type Na+/H+ or K+/H+ antiporter